MKNKNALLWLIFSLSCLEGVNPCGLIITENACLKMHVWLESRNSMIPPKLLRKLPCWDVLLVKPQSIYENCGLWWIFAQYRHLMFKDYSFHPVTSWKRAFIRRDSYVTVFLPMCMRSSSRGCSMMAGTSLPYTRKEGYKKVISPMENLRIEN